MHYPEDVRYTAEHEWARLEGGLVTVGITGYASEQLGDVVFVELPAIGKKLKRTESFGVVEAVKTVSDLYSPVGGEVAEVNEALVENPGLVNQAPYGEGWMIRIKPERVEELKQLMNHEDYGHLVEEAEHA